jgi:hypothetical protein
LDRYRLGDILISNTLHVSKVFTTSITTFEETLYQLKITVLTGLQILNQVELVKGAINQLVAKDQANLGL